MSRSARSLTSALLRVHAFNGGVGRYLLRPDPHGTRGVRITGRVAERTFALVWRKVAAGAASGSDTWISGGVQYGASAAFRRGEQDAGNGAHGGRDAPAVGGVEVAEEIGGHGTGVHGVNEDAV